MSQQQDLFKKMNEDYESLARYIQPPLPNSQQATNTTAQTQAAFPQDLASQTYSNQYIQPNMYDPYAYGAAGYNYYAPEQQQFMGVQDVRGYDQYSGQNGYYQNRSGDYDRNGYQGRRPYQGYNSGGRRFDDREKKPYNSYNRYSDQGGSSGGGHGGFHIAGTKIFVNNIEAHITDVDITRLFGVYGKINDMKVFHRPDQNYAYIIYDRYEDAFTASSQPSPSPNWSISLAKSKNTVMQYQQSTMYSSIPGGAPPPPLPFKGIQKFYPGGGTVESYKRNFNKYGTEPSSQIQQKSSEGEDQVSSQPQQNQQPQQQQQDQAGKLPAESHLSNMLNNSKEPNQLIDFMPLPPDRAESLATNKSQLNQTLLVREIWVSNINANCQNTIREIMEDNFGLVEELEFFPRGDQSFAFIKFFMVQTAHLAFSNKEKIAALLESNQLKLTYSDPSRRRNIIGDHKDYMKDENLSPVLYVSFPYGFKVSKHVIQKIASDYGVVLNVTVKRSEDPKSTSSVLIEFQDLTSTKFAYSNLREDHDRMHPRCEFAILLNSDKFIKENGLKMKDKNKEGTASESIQNFPAKAPFSGSRSNYEHGQSSNGDHDFSENQQNENDQEGGYAAEGSEEIDEAYNNEEDDEEYIWSGFISLKQMGRCGMDAKVLSGPSILDFENHNLIMNQKCSLDEPLKSTPYAVVLFKPSNQTQIKPFKEIKQYIDSTPNQAGVVVAQNFTIYLIPTSEEATHLHSQLKAHNIVAICHTPESLRSQKTKKEQKIEEKYQTKENSANYDLSSDLGKKSNQGGHEEDLYNPSITNDSKTRNETNLSDLIDNPNLVENMMKNVQ